MKVKSAIKFILFCNIALLSTSSQAMRERIDVEIRPNDNNQCPNIKKHSCQCGAQNTFTIRVKQCVLYSDHVFFRMFDPICVACDQIDDQDRCTPYHNCAECRDGNPDCYQCPVGKYGSECLQNCQCLQGAPCDITTGQCICPPGYRLPNCAPIPCLPPTSPTGGNYYPVKSEYNIGESVTFKCNDQYSLEGSSKRLCMFNDKWNSPPPTCSLRCPLVSAPLYGSVQQPQNPISESQMKYFCNSGYQLLGESVRTCQHDGTWSGVAPICDKKILCNSPKPINFGTYYLLSEEVSPGSLVIYACHQDYILVGTAQIVCGINGQWSSNKPTCVYAKNVCRHPEWLENGDMTIVRENENQAIVENTTIEFRCKPFYYMQGAPRTICKINGEWSAEMPKCLKLTVCSDLQQITNGGTEVFMPVIPTSGSSSAFRTAIMPRGYVTNRLSGSIRFRSTLQNESVEARAARLQTVLPTGYCHVGTRVIFSCESRYYDLIGSRMRTCTTTGEWSGRQPACIPVCGRSSARRMPYVAHGEVSPVGQWPWQVAIARRLAVGDHRGPWFLTCGGVLITEHWVLTAAHCVTYAGMTHEVPADEFLLSFGKHFRNKTKDDDDVQRRKLTDLYVHGYYEPKTFESDIALLRLRKPVTLTSRVQPICLPGIINSDSRVIVGNNGTISGWGEDENGMLAEELKHVQVQVVDSETCEDEYRANAIPLIVSDNMYCAGYDKGQHDSCTGDSGSPMVFPITDRKDKWVLEGLVSWGSPTGCANPKQYGGYVRIQRFLEWIHDHI